jgi:DNA primase catalytic core
MNGFDKLTASMEKPKSPDRLGGKKTLKVGGFLEEFEKDDVKAKVDITELFGFFGVELSKKGKSFMGRCPWHEDETPSLSVDREKGLYNCFGCGESGDVFDLVEKMKGFDFKEALAFLKKWTGPSTSSGTDPRKRPFSPSKSLPKPSGDNLPEKEETLPVTEEKAPSGLLNTVADHFRKRFSDHPEAAAYLRKRGLNNTALWERFGVGFSDGSLLDKIGETQKAELIEAGILNEKDGRVWEHFKDCVVFPILDENDQTVGFYGRDIADPSTGSGQARSFKHRYLKGDHRGVWNRKASKVYPDGLILAECIIDALSLVEAGVENVQALYGANGFTDEHLELLKANRVKTVITGLDNDEPGRKAAAKLAERLTGEGFTVKDIGPVGAKDWNEMLTAGKLSKEFIRGSVEVAKALGREEEAAPSAAYQVREDGIAVLFTFGAVSYRVVGAKESFGASLRVNVKAEAEDVKYFDNLDLYSARSRSAFAGNFSRQTGAEVKRIERDLVMILEHFETDRERKATEAAKPATVEPTEEEKRIGIEFLKNPDLFAAIVKDMEMLGYVGEDLNKQLLYLCASSRILDDTISVLLLSESASGKSLLVDTVKKLIPPEDTVAVTSLSDQALNYMGDLLHKFLILGEAVHSDAIEHQIREMLSGKELSRLVTVKDEKTGKMESKIVRKPVIVASVMSGTNHAINPENASRCFVVNTDESREQTRRIHESQRRKYTLSRYGEKENAIPAIISRHHAAQRLLRKLPIVNPFAEFLDFPVTLMRTRRDHDRFLDLIACVCFLRQYQKPLKHEGGTEFIECDLEDYRIAYNIMVNGVLTATMADLPHQAADLYGEVLRVLREKAKREDLKPEEVSLTQREIRERTGLNHMFVKRYLRELADYEYLKVKGNRHRGAAATYSLAADEEMNSLDFGMIPSPEEMGKKLKQPLKSGKTSLEVESGSLSGIARNPL